MDKLILRVFKIVSLLFILLAAVLQVLVLVQGEDNLSDQVLNNYILLSYVALGLTAFLAILFPIIFMIQNPKSAIKVIAVLAFLVVIGFICYSVASNSFNLEQLQKLKTTAEISQWVGAALIFTYLLGGLAILSVVYAGISNLFK